jgi:hypothetical protein
MGGRQVNPYLPHNPAFSEERSEEKKRKKGT